ncbi:MAG: hypothetical protein ACOZF0_15830 [Thermodesulfobacteriota bacterium]
MARNNRQFRSMISSDWNECLAPCGPFDCMAFVYPELASALENIFRQYTGGRMTLGAAAAQIKALLPAPMTADQMDAYLAKSFRTYTGVPELIEWCLSNDILFMINTTGMQGYFQRVLAKKLLPPVPVIAAHPMIRFENGGSGPSILYDLLEIQDKGVYTELAARHFNIPLDKIVVMGDSGGDGPHFDWGRRNGARLVSSMGKPSLDSFCRRNGIALHFQHGRTYAAGESPDRGAEMTVDFLALTRFFA